MDKTYIKFFQELTKTTATLAEQVAALDKSKNDLQGTKTAISMRDDYNTLYDKLNQKDLNEDNITRSDFAKFLVGALIISSQLQEKIKQQDKVLHGYKVDIIPKLERIINETKTDEEAKNLAQEIFQIQEKLNEKNETNV